MSVIGIDARFALYDRRGIGNYTLELIDQLKQIGSDDTYLLYVDREDKERLLPNNDNFKVVLIPSKNYFIWEQCLLPLFLYAGGVDILHCPANTAPLWLNKRVKLVVSLLDVMFLKDYAQLPRSSSVYQRLGRYYRKFVVSRVIKRASRIITISDYSRRDILAHYPWLKPDIISVTHLAVNEKCRSDPDNKVLKKWGISGDYILLLGAVDPRKNTAQALKAFLDLKERKLLKPKLVITGLSDRTRKPLYEMAGSSNDTADVIFTEFVPEKDLAELYRNAFLFLYPSLYEGFGLPVLEAMTYGVPVIAANRTSIPEIADGAAWLIDPQDPDDLKVAIMSLATDGERREEMIKRGSERAKSFSWKRTAEQTLKVYESLK